MHYRRAKLYGDPGRVTVIRDNELARFWSKVDRRSDDECWPWTGATNKDGYGRFRLRDTHEPAARTAYRLLVGPIPAGLYIDHVWSRGCTRRDCVNPAHLEPVTPAVNIQRGEPARRTHCPQGHEYTPENTSTTSGTGRTCVTCNRERSRRRRAGERGSVTEAVGSGPGQ
jgi:hypothetical protein